MRIKLTKKESDELIQEIKSVPWMIGKHRIDHIKIKSLELVIKNDGEEVIALTGTNLNYSEKLSGTHYLYKGMHSYDVCYGWYIKESRNIKINDIVS